MTTKHSTVDLHGGVLLPNVLLYYTSQTDFKALFYFRSSIVKTRKSEFGFERIFETTVSAREVLIQRL